MKPEMSDSHDQSNFISWLLTIDHKKIGKLYLLGTSFFFLIGCALAVALQVAHVTTNQSLSNPSLYARLFSAHGMIMVFMFAGPAILATIGNSVLPTMIGTNRVAYPRLNRLGWWLYVIGCVTTCVSLAISGFDTDWTGISSTARAEQLSTGLLTIGLILLSVCLAIVSLNVIFTIHRHRARGTTIFGLPILAWTLYLTALAVVIGMTERTGLLSIMLFAQLARVDVLSDAFVLRQFNWFSANALVYATILPVVGVISEIIPTFTKSRLFATNGVKYASLALAALSLIVWGQHLYVSGQNDLTSVLFSFYSLLLAIPSTFILGSWLITLYRGTITLSPPMLYALASMLLYLVGGLSGGILSIAAINVQLHGSAFVVGHLHFAMLGSGVAGFLAAVHYWWPLQFGRTYSEGWSRAGAGLFFAGTILICFPFFMLGMQGVGRRILEPGMPHQLEYWISAAGLLLLGSALIVTIRTLLKSRECVSRSSNQWEALGPDFNPEFAWPYQSQVHSDVATLKEEV